MESPPEQDAATCAGLAEPAREPHASPAATQPAATTSDDGIRDREDDRTGETNSATSPMASPPVTTPPPYWLVQHSYNDPAESTPEGGGITMRDNESEDRGGRNSACWARSVEIPDYVVVNSSATNIGAFVVFNVRVETMNVSRCPPSPPFLRGLRGLCQVPSRGGRALMQDACPGRLHEHPETILRVRRPAAAADADVSQLCGRRAAPAAQEPDIQVPPAVPGEEAVVPPILPQVSISALRSLRGTWQERARTRVPFASVLTGRALANVGHSCILLNPEFSASPVLKEFLFA